MVEAAKSLSKPEVTKDAGKKVKNNSESSTKTVEAFILTQKKVTLHQLKTLFCTVNQARLKRLVKRLIEENVLVGKNLACQLKVNTKELKSKPTDEKMKKSDNTPSKKLKTSPSKKMDKGSVSTKLSSPKKTVQRSLAKSPKNKITKAAPKLQKPKVSAKSKLSPKRPKTLKSKPPVKPKVAKTRASK